MLKLGAPGIRGRNTFYMGPSRKELFDIASLFKNGEGAWLDAQDMTTMFSDMAAQTQVQDEQIVSLMFDKSKYLSLGSEMIIGGDFESGLAGTKNDSAGSVSTYTLNSVSPISGTQDGKLIITTAASNRPLIQFQSLSQRVGQAFELSFDYKVMQGEPYLIGVNVGSALVRVDKALVGGGKFTARYVRDSANNADRSYLYFGQNTGALQIDNVSLKPIEGNSISQVTSSNRPLLRGGEIVFDAIDDFFMLQPASLPLLNCTVITASKAKGVVIQTGKTFSTSLTINENFCQYFLINRTLTLLEQQRVISDFEKRLRMI